jgi:hypothetical protein
MLFVLQGAPQSYCHDFSQVDSWTSLEQGKEEMGQEQTKAIKKLKHIRGMRRKHSCPILRKNSNFGS